MSRSKIEWTDETWNPIRGCTTVSEGCRNCYAARQASRFNGPGGAYEGLAYHGKWAGVARVVESEVERPLRWRRPRRCFVCSMSDLFHPDVPAEVIARLLDVMRRADRHTFQVLTKRPERMLCPLAEHHQAHGSLPRNVWLGVSAEDQATLDARAPWLASIDGAAVRFLSAEPLLGPLDLGEHMGALSWVIAGGESGPGARPMHPEWVRGVRDQCLDAGVPFLFKQWGAWQNGSRRTGPSHVVLSDGTVIEDSLDAALRSYGDGYTPRSPTMMARVGKTKAGRQLDGVTWDQFPAPAAGRVDIDPATAPY